MTAIGNPVRKGIAIPLKVPQSAPVPQQPVRVPMESIVNPF